MVPGTRRLVAALAVTTLALAACGTRVDPTDYEAALVEQPQLTTPAGPGQDASLPTDGSEPPPSASAEPQDTSSSTLPEHDTSPTVGSPTETVRGATPGGERRRSTGGSTATLSEVSREVVGDVITVGMHVPETGAAPMPTDWKDILRVVEDHINREQPIHGRQLRIVVEDDGYDSSVGRAGCRRLLSHEPLLVLGHSGPSPQEACAALFSDHGIPYLTRGTLPEVREGRPLVFFTTVPDDVNGRLVADYAIAELDALRRPVGVLGQPDTRAGTTAFVARIRERGGTVAVVEEGAPRQSDYGAVIQKFRAAGVELAFLSTPPVDAIQIAVQARGEGFRATWLGGGTYWNYDLTLEAAGPAMDGAISLSPWASIDSPAAGEFRAVYAAARPDREPEDLGLIMYAWTQLLRELLDEAGPDLSRRSVLETLQTFEFSRPYWNPVSFARHGPDGVATVTVFRADGQGRRWRQLTDFRSSF